jgi:hypothetical protein
MSMLHHPPTVRDNINNVVIYAHSHNARTQKDINNSITTDYHARAHRS